MDTLSAVAMLSGMFVTGIGFWVLGQWLRGRDYGDRLDKINAVLSRGQRNIGHFLGPLSGGFVGVTRSISHVPFLGNRRSREMWEGLKELE